VVEKTFCVATRLNDPVATRAARGDVGARHRPDPPAEPLPLHVCDARPGSRTERLAREGLGNFHPILVGVVIVAVGYTLLALCAIGAGLLLTEVILPGAAQRWDASVVRTLADPRPALNDATLVGSYLSEFATVLVLGGLLVAISLWRRWFRLAVLFTVGICLEGAVYVTTTYFVTRTRPGIPRLEQLIVSDSFPSGHVAAAVVLWFALGLLVWNITRNRWVRGLTVVAVALAPVVVALSRMYRGMHYPTDAMVGYAIGWACVGVAVVTVRAVWAAADRRHES
jgi:membrane-associated phospholipid phosphatase